MQLSLSTAFFLLVCCTAAYAQLRLTHPNGGERYAPGDTIEFTWTGISLNRPVTLEFSSDAGETWIEIADSLKRGRYSWEVPESFSDRCLARVTEIVDSAVTILTSENRVLQWTEFSPDSRHVLTSSADQTVKIWDARTGEMVRQITDSNEAYGLAHYSPDGLLIVTREVGGWVAIYNTVTGALVRRMKIPQITFGDTRFSPDGTMVVAAGSDNAGQMKQLVYVFDVATGDTLQMLDPNNTQIGFIAFSPDSRKILVPTGDGEGKVWDLQTGQLLLTLAGHTDALTDGEFNADGTRLITAGRDRTVRLWDAATGDSIALLDHGAFISSAEFSPDGTQILTAGYDYKAKLWSAETGEFIRVVATHKNILVSARFSPDGRTILASAAYTDPIPRQWDVETGALLREFSGHTYTIHDARFSPDSRSILTRDETLVKIWHDELPDPMVDVSDALWRIALPASVEADSVVYPFSMAVVPNPTTESVTLSCSFPHPSTVRFSIVDLLGREMMRVDREVRTRGDYFIQISTASLPPGWYLVAVQSDDGVISRPIVQGDPR